MIYFWLPVCLFLALLTWAAVRELRKLAAEREALRLALTERERQARFCPYTGLANRRHAAEWLGEALANTATRPAVMLACFSTSGADESQEWSLAASASQVLDRFASGQSLVARLAPGQYLLAFRGPIEPTTIVTLARGASSSLGKLLSHGQVLRLGVAFAMSGDDPDALLARAVRAIQEVRVDSPISSGFSEPELGAENASRERAASELAEAIREGRIEPFFQPFVELESGRILGFEVLARWRDSQGRLHLPASFVALAEENGLVGEMYHALLDTAAREVRSWPQDWNFALNLSVRQFGDERLIERTLASLHAAGLHPERLEIEISEQALELDPESARTLISRFREVGIRVTLDNFGTGKLQLKELARYAFDRIKVDQASLAADGEEDPAFVLGLVAATARHLGVPVLVQGIETLAGAEVAQQQGCTIGQGHLFGRPDRKIECFRLEGILAPSSNQAA